MKRALIVLVAFGAGTLQSAEPLTLWYRQPAAKWVEALPIGNGRVGGMVFGGVTNERVQFNEQSLWLGDEVEMGSYQPFGDLFIEQKAGEVTSYRRTLDLAEAVQTVAFTADGVSFVREAFVSHPDQVMVIRITADKPGAITAIFRLTDMHKARIGVAADRMTAVGALTNGLEYLSQIRVVPEGGQVARAGESIRVTGADRVTVLLNAGTSFANDPMKNWRGEHPRARVESQLEAAKKKGFEALKAAHMADYRALFDRVAIRLGSVSSANSARPTDDRVASYDRASPDTGLETLLFQHGRYLLISSSRPGGLPANLQGIWNADVKPAWYSGYTCNINLQMNYWPAELTGLSECHEPMFQWVRNMSVVYKRTQDERVKTAKGRGWSSYSTTNPMGGTSHWGVHRPNSAWLVQHLWFRYAFTGDKDWLRREAYPFIKEVVEFWEDRLVEGPDGKLVTPDGWSPEHGPVKKGDKIVLQEGDRTPHPGVSYDQQIVWDLFSNYIDASEALGVDAEYRAKVVAMRDRLLGPKIGRWGQIQEWAEDVDDPKDRHRHTSHLFALHPGRQISPLTTPGLAQAAKVTLNGRGDTSTGWSTAWKINFWARLHDGDRAHKLVEQLLDACILPNLFDTHPPFQIDGNFGYTSGVAEMLLQSHMTREEAGNLRPETGKLSSQTDRGETGQVSGLKSQVCILHLLPALPAVWAEGEVKGLRARGGFVVDMTWKGGRLVSADVKSLLGNPCVLRVNGEEMVVRINAGETYRWSGS